KSFRDSKYYGPVLKVRKFMINDIQNTLSLKETPNFLLALGISGYKEYCGRLLTIIATRNGSKCFNAFFEKLGPEYRTLRNNKDEIYRSVRCGLAHSYLIEDKNSVIDMKSGLACGIEYDNNTS